MYFDCAVPDDFHNQIEANQLLSTQVPVRSTQTLRFLRCVQFRYFHVENLRTDSSKKKRTGLTALCCVVPKSYQRCKLLLLKFANSSFLNPVVLESFRFHWSFHGSFHFSSICDSFASLICDSIPSPLRGVALQSHVRCLTDSLFFLILFVIIDVYWQNRTFFSIF